MPQPLTVGDIHKSLKAQVQASQRIYETVIELADIAHEARLDNPLNQRLENAIQELSRIADALSDNIDEVTKRVMKSLETAGQSGG